MAEVPAQNKDIENKDIETRVKKVVAEILGMEQKEITPETSLSADTLDSLERVELLMELEDEFGMEVSDEEAEKIKTVGEVIKLIETKTRGC